MRKIRFENASVVLLDVGDVSALLCEGGQPGDIKADAYAAAYPLMRYDAVGLGDLEARFVRESGRVNLYGKSVPLVSANVVDMKSGKPMVSASWTVKRTNRTVLVGITSVLADKAIDEETQNKLGIRVVPPIEALKRRIPELRRKSDIIVLLSHTDFATAKSIASEVKGIDVILFSGLGYGGASAEKVGDTILMAAKPRGPALGKLVLDIDADRTVMAYAGDYVAVEKGIEDDPAVLKIVERYDDDIRAYDESHRQTTTQVRAYATASECGKCHQSQYTLWEKTAHAKAFETLKASSRQRDPECSPCHTTGYRKGGFRTEAITADLAGVQCESCHGPGVEHSKSPSRGYGVVGGKTACLACHDPANSPKFNFEKYSKLVAHGKSAAQGGKTQ